MRSWFERLTFSMRRLVLAFALLASLGAQGSRQLRVAVAANLQQAFPELQAAFARAHPGIRVQAAFSASGTHYAQLSHRAPFDLFLSADTELPDRLSAAALGLDPPFLYAQGVLVLWAPKGSPLNLEQGLQGLSNPSVKHIALANPKLAPYGAAAEAALRQSGLLESLRPKFIVGESLAQAAQFASSAADAGFIALGQARAPALAGKGRHAEVPEALHPPLRQAGLILAWAKDPAAARSFRDFLLGAEGQAILRRHGYREAR